MNERNVMDVRYRFTYSTVPCITLFVEAASQSEPAGKYSTVRKAHTYVRADVSAIHQGALLIFNVPIFFSPIIKEVK